MNDDGADRAPEGEQASAREVLDSVGRHLGAVTDATRRAAEGMRSDLDSVRQRLGEEDDDGEGRTAAFAELVETVIARTEEVRENCERLLAMVSGARGESVTGDVPEVAAETGETPRRRPTRPRPSGSAVAEGLRVLTTQIAAEGASPEQTAQRLRDEFGVEDAEEIVAAVLGTPVSDG